MAPKILYRAAAVLLVVFAGLHTVGFTQIDPGWGIDALIAQLRQTTFLAQGQTRSYWDFYVGFGISVSIWQVLAGLIAWELGGLPPALLSQLRMVRWGLVVAMAGTAWISWRYFFPAPLIFSVLVTLCLGLAAWRAQTAESGGVG